MDEEGPAVMAGEMMTSLIPSPRSLVKQGVANRRPRARFILQILIVSVVLFLHPSWANAHVGSPDVFFDGKVGPYPTHIAIRMPPVVPGRAQIEVRPETTEPLTVSVLPLYSRTAVKNAPPAEPARSVIGDPGLYSGDLWLMSVGAYSIEVRIRGSAGESAIQIPVNSVATHQLPLSPFLRNLLLLFGSVLAFGAVAIVYSAASESVLVPRAVMQETERRKGLVAGIIAAVVLALALAGGWHWWMADEQDFRRHLREGAWPDLSATVDTKDHQHVLHLTLGEKTFKPDYGLPLVPDHGKPLHLFLIREPGHDAFAHLHPVRRGGKNFDLALPELPPGDYRIFCDLTLSDSGISSTASSLVHLDLLPSIATPSSEAGSNLKADPDDSWFAGTPEHTAPTDGGEATFPLPLGRQAIWKSHPPLRARHDAHLEFVFHDADGKPLPLEPYMGMMSHGAILRIDGGVFAHLHPVGNFSMAAQSFFAAKIAREAGDSSPTNAIDHTKMHHAMLAGEEVTSIVLPYEFPTPGEYQIWVQVKSGGEVLTATFRTTVAP